MDDPPTGQVSEIKAKARWDWFSALVVTVGSLILLIIVSMGPLSIWMALTPTDSFAGVGWVLFFWIVGLLFTVGGVALVILCVRSLMSGRRGKRNPGQPPRHARTQTEE